MTRSQKRKIAVELVESGGLLNMRMIGAALAQRFDRMTAANK